MSKKDIKITIIGDLCKDVFIYGKSDRLSPEAPVPIFEELHRVENWGMAGNVLANLESLCKNDTNKYLIKSHLSPTFETKIRYVDDKSNHIFLRVDQKKERDYNFQMTFEIQDDISSSDIVIISDYDKNYLSNFDIQEITSLKSLNTIVLIDTKKKIRDKQFLNRIDYIKMNLKEYEQNKSVIDESNEHKLIMTMGEKGTIYKNQTFHVEQKQTIDVSGAGDTFLASLAFSLSKKETIFQAINFANEKASSVVTKRGVSII
jgi:D-beta-D-heptose 7-phosphate kinase/D-beta-D-heptose 1-phosphate adenosyltransferase